MFVPEPGPSLPGTPNKNDPRHSFGEFGVKQAPFEMFRAPVEIRENGERKVIS
jgi:hypothetical protein